MLLRDFREMLANTNTVAEGYRIHFTRRHGNILVHDIAPDAGEPLLTKDAAEALAEEARTLDGIVTACPMLYRNGDVVL